LEDTELEVKKGETVLKIPSSAWVSQTCKYCLGRGREIYNQTPVPCRCLKYIPKEAQTPIQELDAVTTTMAKEMEKILEDTPINLQ